MSKAIWNGVVLAEAPAERCERVEGNVYFPPDAISREHFKESATHTICPWKGTASYYTITAGGQENPDAAWYYPDPKPEAAQIKGFVAFWKGVTVEA
jgi:uncharacterized protein (DUF427 family)